MENGRTFTHDIFARKDILDKVYEYREIYRRLLKLGIEAPNDIVRYLEDLESGEFDITINQATEEFSDGLKQVQRIDLTKIPSEVRYIYIEKPEV
jgi:hypothetical protein